MSKHNRNNNPNFRPTDHQYPQDNRQARGKAASAQTPNHPRSEAERDRDRELLRAIFGEEITANRIMDALKGHPMEAFDRSIDVHISRIRAVIEDDPKAPQRVLTVRGAGYVFAKTQDN